MGLFIDHVNETLRRMRRDPVTSLSTDGTEIAFKIQEAVKRAVQHIWNARQWKFKGRLYTLIAISGTSTYVLDKRIGEPYKFMSSVSPYIIHPVNEDTFDAYEPNPIASGNPELAIMFEVVGVETQPTTASTISAVSNSTSDTAQTVLIAGIVGGELDYEEIALNGTSPVSTTKLFSHIESITKNITTAGIITIKSDSDTVTNGTLARAERTVRLKKIRFFPTPSSTVTVTVKNFKAPVILTHKLQDTEIPQRWDYVVDQFTFAYALQSLGQAQLSEFTAALTVASSLLDDEMAVTEKLTSDEPVVLMPFDVLGENPWLDPPSGTAYVQY